MGALLPSDVDEGLEPPRLTREMSSRKLIALDFIKGYFARWGHSPTLGELAAHLDVSRKRAYDLVHALAEEEMIQVTAGKTRGIRLVERGEELSEADVIVRLVAMGWTVGKGAHVLLPPADGVVSPGVAHLVLQALTTKGLHELPDLDFNPGEADEGTGTSGQQIESGAGERPARAPKGNGGSPSGEQSGLGAPTP